MNKSKIGFALAVGLLALAGGIYFSGFLALLLLKLDAGQLKWSTYFEYVRALDLPQVRPYAERIRTAGYIGFGLPSLAYLALLVLILKPARKSLHGDARFANAADLARKGMFKPSPDGIVVGRFNGRLVRLGGQQFVILAAPTRSGKGVGVVIPNLLDYQESMVVLDIKQENFDLTSGWRASQGQDVFLFNPFAEDRRTHRWNPLTYVSNDPAFRVSDLAPTTRNSGSARRATRSWRLRCICSSTGIMSSGTASRTCTRLRWGRSTGCRPAMARN